MFFGNDKKLSKISEIGNIRIDKDEIKGVDKTKYLGLTIDERLSWNQQCEIVKGKLKGGLNSIRKLRDMQSQLFLVYQALVESYSTLNMETWYGIICVKRNLAHYKRYRTGHFTLLNQHLSRIRYQPHD